MERCFSRALTPLTLAFALFSTEDTLAASDSASSHVILEFTEVIYIGQVNNVIITDPTPGLDAVGIDPFCVSGTGFNTFSITFESNDGNTDPAFLLTDGNISIPYSVGFDNSLNGSFTPMVPTVALSGNQLNTQTCTNYHENARFEITVLSHIWQNSSINNGGPYHDTLLITVASE